MTTINKNLIYFACLYNKDFFKLLSFCIDSLVNVNYNGDILIITDNKELALNSIQYDGNIYFMDYFADNRENSSTAKLSIYLYENINKYNKIIYCDVDTLWIKSPDVLFNEIKEDLFYLADDFTNLILSQSWHYGDYLLNNEEKKEILNKKIKGLNCGVFGFKSSLLKHLENMNIFHNQENKNSKVAEQSTMNVYLWRNNLFTNYFNNFVSHCGYKRNLPDETLIHFPGGIGEFTNKYNKMLNFKR